MKIVRARGIDAAASAQGSVVVIDVLRAFTTAAFAFAHGANEIRLVAERDEAFALRARDPNLVLVGEIGGRPIDGFDFGNSPEEIDEADFTGRKLVLRSSSGTQGVARAENARSIHLGSLVVARATARELRRIGDDVTLLAMGWAGNGDGPEDDACGDYLEALLRGVEPDREKIAAIVRASPAARKAVDPEIAWITPGDLDRALEFDRFDFHMSVERRDGALIARARRSQPSRTK